MPIELIKQIDTYQVRDRDSFKHVQEITKPYGQIDAILEWAKTELRGEWRWQLIDLSTQFRPGRYIFYFDEERDCLAFALKWS